jgi:Zn-dependent peptidase ImmA (M78 family)/DNA-binding XRE family transcriptional regulator
MASSNPALVNHNLLAWAREQSGYAPAVVAKRLSIKPERLLAWERGDVKPSVRQAKELARFYHRPFGLFFLPQPPSLPPLAAEYRRLPGVTSGVESPELRLALRTMSYRREVLLQLLQEMEQGLTEFNAQAHLREPPGEVGGRLRELLGVSLQEQFEWKDEWQAWRRWREAVEFVGVIVFQFPKVSLEQARGLSLLKFPMPAIGINSKETAPGARIYTLVHEFTHIALAAGHEERAALEETRNDAEWLNLERFAEETASDILIPDEALQSFLRRISVGRDEWDVPLVRNLAAKFRVTPLAMATRLRAADQFSWEGYREWRESWAKYVSALKPSKGGFAHPVDKTIGRAGRPFTQIVIEALDANRITAVEACRYLDLRFEHFDKLRFELRGGPDAQQPMDDSE